MRQIKTIRGLVNEIARREGKKSPTKIGNIREIVGIISDLSFEIAMDHDVDVLIDTILVENGERRAKRRKK